MAPRACVTAAIFALGAAAAPLKLRTPKAGVAGELTPDADLSARVTNALGSLFEIQAPAAEEQKKSAQPVQVTVADKDVKALLAKLSPSCEKQFSAILHEKHPPMHSFGSPGTNSSSDGCKALGGALCATKAQVSQENQMNGRSMSSATNVVGDGCLPNSCIGGGDLEVLATFMKTQARQVIPGSGMHIELSVDCTSCGGSLVKVGQSATEAKAEAKAQAKQEAKVEKQRTAEAVKSKSETASKGHGGTSAMDAAEQARQAEAQAAKQAEKEAAHNQTGDEVAKNGKESKDRGTAVPRASFAFVASLLLLVSFGASA